MRITFYGGAEEVTGSCTLLETGKGNILIDCGAFQGGWKERLKNNYSLPFAADKIDVVIVTHAHYDHCGRLPKLIAAGFKGPIFATPATGDLIKIVLEDSLHVMETDYRKSGILPFYNEEQMNQVISQIKPLKYGERITNRSGISFSLLDAGHILGSASVVISVDGKAVLFSGDLGNVNSPIIRDTEPPVHADVVVMESTYALRQHEPHDERMTKLKEALLFTAEHHGVLLVPAFAIERTQEILWELHRLADEHKLPENLKFYLDSPMAVKVTDEFRHHPEDYDKEALEAYNLHHDFLSFPRLSLSRTIDESKAINSAPAPKVIIAGAGMMDGGRILHHLTRYLPLANTTVLVVGYQSRNSLGRKIMDGEKFVQIWDKYIPVHARVIKADSFSAHADGDKLIDWLAKINPKPKVIFLNHGEKRIMKEFANFLHSKYSLGSEVPRYGKSYQI